MTVISTRLSRLLVLIPLALLVVAAGAEGAVAGGHHGARVAGIYTATDFGNTECEPLDEVRLRCTTSGFVSTYEGDLVGTSTTNFEQVINCATGRTVGHGAETFTGTIRGKTTGTLSWRLVLSADFDCATFFPSNLHIVAVVTKGTAGLAGVRGVLLFDDTTYSGLLV